MLYALIKDEIVERIIVVYKQEVIDSLIDEGYIAIDVTETLEKPGPKWIYSNGTFEAPEVPVGLRKRKLSKFRFRERFTFNELLVLDNFADDPNISQQQKQALNTIMNNFRLSDEIDLDHPLTAQGLNYLADVGFLTQKRVSEILS